MRLCLTCVFCFFSPGIAIECEDISRNQKHYPHSETLRKKQHLIFLNGSSNTGSAIKNITDNDNELDILKLRE